MNEQDAKEKAIEECLEYFFNDGATHLRHFRDGKEMGCGWGRLPFRSRLGDLYDAGRANTPNVVIVYKDGTNKSVPRSAAWEFESDPDYLVTIADRYAAASQEPVPQWVRIDGPESLPKTDGRYWLAVRYIPDGSITFVGSGFAASERSPWAFIVSRNAHKPKPIVEAVAWMPILPYEPPNMVAELEEEIK